jgi:perosamine synthetase
MSNNISKKIYKLIRSKFKPPLYLHEPYLNKISVVKIIKNCIENNHISSVGPYIQKFENEIKYITGAKNCVSVANGTSAIYLSLFVLGGKLNDEVILPAFNFIAAANACLQLRAIPHFAEIENDTFGIDPVKLEKYLSSSTYKKRNIYFNKKTNRPIKFIIVTHVYGHICKIDAILRVAKKFNLKLIEDASEALGSFYLKKHAGTFGDLGILSFNGNKTITCGSGGAILTNNKKMAKKLKHLSTHAKVNDLFDHIHDDIGYNYRMSNLSAAVGCAQIEKIKKIVMAKRKNFNFYNRAFKKNKIIKIYKEPKFSFCNYWLITAFLKKPELKKKLLKFFKLRGYGFRTVWRPLHSLKIFKDCPRDSMSISNEIFRKTINLPSSASISL